MTQMERRHTTKQLTIASSANLSGAFHMGPWTMAILRMPAAWTAASVGFKVSDEEDGTYLPLYDDDGTLVQIDSPAASKAYSFPPETAGCLWVKLWSQDGSASNTNQDAARTMQVDLKA